MGTLPTARFSNRSPIDNDGQRAKGGGKCLISGRRMSSRPPGGQSRGVSSPGFPRPSGFGHPGLCLSRPPGGHRQSSLPPAIRRSGFRLPYVACTSFRLPSDVFIPSVRLPYVVQAHFSGIVQGRRHHTMAQFSIGDRLPITVVRFRLYVVNVGSSCYIRAAYGRCAAVRRQFHNRAQAQPIPAAARPPVFCRRR